MWDGAERGHTLALELQGDHLGDLVALFQADHGSLVGAMEQVGVGAGAQDAALVDQDGVQAIEQGWRGSYPGRGFDARQPGFALPAHVQVEKVHR